MDQHILQKKYPQFIYKNYSWEIKDGKITVLFDFLIEPDITFAPSVEISGVPKKNLEKIVKRDLNNLFFHLGLAEIPSYWKTSCAKKVIIRCGYLNRAQIRFWEKLYLNGMAQFYCENRLPFFSPKFTSDFPKPKPFPKPLNIRLNDAYLVPIGGGKDSLVTLEILRENKKAAATFVLNENSVLKKLIVNTGAENLSVRRIFDKKLFVMKKKGFLNGHTPFSSYLAFLSVLLAALSNKKYVAISQERSSQEGNLAYRGRVVNHQYSKSLEFEDDFRDYSRRYLAKKADFFSALRPLYEIQIAKIFSSYKKYFPYFLSCNKAYKITVPTVSSWCGRCPKCLFTFAALYPFISARDIKKIFNRDYFEDKSLIPVMKKLIGEIKPFECVGTKKEILAAFYLSLQKSSVSVRPPALLEYFKDKILPGLKKE